MTAPRQCRPHVPPDAGASRTANDDLDILVAADIHAHGIVTDHYTDRAGQPHIRVIRDVRAEGEGVQVAQPGRR